jgi:hypothetical protein
MYVVHPHPRATPTNSSVLFITFFNQLHAQSLKNPTPHRTGDLRTSRQILLPRVGLSTQLSIVSFNDLHLTLQVSHSMCKALTTLDHTDPMLIKVGCH